MESQEPSEIPVNAQDLFTDHYKPAAWYKRLINLMIDYAVLCLIFYFVLSQALIKKIILLSRNLSDAQFYIITLSILIMVLFYVVFEFTTGKTPGKFITGTMVIREDGRKPSFVAILGRSFSRLITYEVIKFFKKNPIGWHDSWSETLVVNSKDYNNFCSSKR